MGVQIVVYNVKTPYHIHSTVKLIYSLTHYDSTITHYSQDDTCIAQA
jgi:hypothetical protein